MKTISVSDLSLLDSPVVHCRTCDKPLTHQFTMGTGVQAHVPYCNRRCFRLAVKRNSDTATERVKKFLDTQLERGNDISRYISSPWKPALTFEYSMLSPRREDMTKLLATYKKVLDKS